MKKYFLFLILIIILVVSILFYMFYKHHVNSTYSTLYEANEYGQLRDPFQISEEQFDEYGNLTHYKFNQQDYNFEYTFDANDRIIKVTDNHNNFIEIQYTTDNKISKIERNYSAQKETYSFTYNENETKIIKTCLYTLYSTDDSFSTLMSLNDTEEKNIFQHSNEEELISETYSCLIEEFKYNNEDYLIYTETSDNTNQLITEILYKKDNMETKYNNLYNMLALNYPGYVSICNNGVFNSFQMGFYPIFNCDKIIYIKNNPVLICNYYYDSKNRDLMYSENNNPTILYMYDETNNNQYTGTSISVSINLNNSDSTYYYTEFKDTLNSNMQVVKREFLKKEISKEEFEIKLPKYIEYLEANKIDIPSIVK